MKSKKNSTKKSTDMKASELLIKIQKSLNELPEFNTQNINEKFSEIDNKPDIISCLREYNSSAFAEICSNDKKIPDFEINSSKIENFLKDINFYFDTYALKNANKRIFISCISLYLTFIAKKPLHPPDISNFGEMTILKKGNFFYCSGKKKYIKDSHSLCKYCVCRTL